MVSKLFVKKPAGHRKLLPKSRQFLDRRPFMYSTWSLANLVSKIPREDYPIDFSTQSHEDPEHLSSHSTLNRGPDHLISPLYEDEEGVRVLIPDVDRPVIRRHSLISRSLCFEPGRTSGRACKEPTTSASVRSRPSHWMPTLGPWAAWAQRCLPLFGWDRSILWMNLSLDGCAGI